MQESVLNKNEDQKEGDHLYYLNQPHPAQVLGIFRTLGIGFNPNEEVEREIEEDGGPLASGKGAKKVIKTKIRNNLV